MSNLEPRAKIGDVVIVKFYNKTKPLELTILASINHESESYSAFRSTRKNKRCACYSGFTDKDILKNLTTNITYDQA